MSQWDDFLRDPPPCSPPPPELFWMKDMVYGIRKLVSEMCARPYDQQARFTVHIPDGRELTFRMYLDSPHVPLALPSPYGDSPLFNSLMNNIVPCPLQDPPVVAEVPVVPREKATTSLVGWRNWWLTSEFKLQSVLIRSHVWEGPVLRADSSPIANRPGAFDSIPGHGIYAYTTAERAFESTERVVGRVKLSGLVMQHEYGYRAEVATIDRLLVNPRTLVGSQVTKRTYAIEGIEECVAALEARYQCEVFTDWRSFLEA